MNLKLTKEELDSIREQALEDFKSSKLITYYIACNRSMYNQIRAFKMLFGDKDD